MGQIAEEATTLEAVFADIAMLAKESLSLPPRPVLIQIHWQNWTAESSPTVFRAPQRVSEHTAGAAQAAKVTWDRST